MTESRSRRVIVVENPFLPDPIKSIIGEVLLDNLQVSFRERTFRPLDHHIPSIVLLVPFGVFHCLPALRIQDRVPLESVELTRHKYRLYVVCPDSQVRSVSFTPAPILALMAVGRTTGLVLDVGYRESTVVPVSPGCFLFRTTLVMFILQSGRECYKSGGS